MLSKQNKIGMRQFLRAIFWITFVLVVPEVLFQIRPKKNEERETSSFDCLMVDWQDNSIRDDKKYSINLCKSWVFQTNIIKG